MERFAALLILVTGLGCNVWGLPIQNMANGFGNVTPTPKLSWKPCFGDFTCTKLKVPLDYSNPRLGTTSIAFIKLAGKNATAKSPNIVIIPGGPGNSGIDLLFSYQNKAGQMFGEQYNFISFDPRGVNNSGLHVDCFLGDAEDRLAFNELHNTGVTNVSASSPFEEQYYSSSIYGEQCNEAVETESPHGYYVTTPAVARDLLTFVDAEALLTHRAPSDAKLWAYGASYGTVVGQTFAALFPDRVGRMVLDGVLNAEQYYHNYWYDNVDQMDEAIYKFASLCHAAGPGNCSFWGPSSANITSRLNSIVLELETHPVALDQDVPTMVTYSDLKALLLNAIYTPIASFPSMADALYQIEHGNVSVLTGLFAKSLYTSNDANHMIQCADASQLNKLTTIDEFKSYVEYTVSKSKYLGDIYPIYVDNVLCRSFEPTLPSSMVIKDPISKLQKPTSFPILFASNTIDPITPSKSAHTMSSRFPGSVLVFQEAVGHTIINQGGSDCYFGLVQGYLQGIVPPANFTCPQQYTPFIDASPA